jgi:esterase/lipase
MEKETINLDYEGHIIVADIMPVGSMPQVICMHGAGTSGKVGFEQLRQMLAENNISSCALDFLGHGETGGNVYESSLKKRTEQVELIIQKTKATMPLIVMGSSMGGYNAIKLTELYPVSLLVLFAPAVYAKHVYEVNFNELFSTFVREEKSWDATDAWEILSRYKGKILIISAGKDEVIPSEIIQKIYNSSTQATHREIINFPESPHGILKKYLKENKEELKMVADKIITLLK